MRALDGGHRSGDCPSALAGATIQIIGRACSFGGDHARTDWIIRRACGGEDAAVGRLLRAAQNGWALAGLAVAFSHCAEGKPPLGVVVGVFFADAQRAPRQWAQPPPFETLAKLEYFGHQAFRFDVALTGDSASVLVLD